MGRCKKESYEGWESYEIPIEKYFMDHGWKEDMRGRVGRAHKQMKVYRSNHGQEQVDWWVSARDNKVLSYS